MAETHLFSLLFCVCIFTRCSWKAIICDGLLDPEDHHLLLVHRASEWHLLDTGGGRRTSTVLWELNSCSVPQHHCAQSWTTSARLSDKVQDFALMLFGDSCFSWLKGLFPERLLCQQLSCGSWDECLWKCKLLTLFCHVTSSQDECLYSCVISWSGFCFNLIWMQSLWDIKYNRALLFFFLLLWFCRLGNAKFQQKVRYCVQGAWSMHRSVSAW